MPAMSSAIHIMSRLGADVNPPAIQISDGRPWTDWWQTSTHDFRFAIM
jgi:hypothetical protein